MSQVKVLVVGTGPSGLAALKEMRESGLDAIAVDDRSNFGGVFSPESGVTFKDLHLTISNIYMSFSDFPAPDVDKGVKYWSKAEYFDYLKRYVEHFQLEQHMQFETTVNKAHFDKQTGLWEVSLTEYANSDAARTSTRIFDKLIVATGSNHKPILPENLADFKGELIHSADYHSPEQVKGKKVLVVGTGEGAADVASSATKTAEKVTVWGRRYPDCAPRFIDPFINDGNYDEQEHISLYKKPNGVLESIITTRAVRNLPLGVWSFALQGLLTDVRKKHGPNSAQGMSRAFTQRAWSTDHYSSDTSMVPTKSAMTLTAAARGLLDIVIAPKTRIDGTTLNFPGANLFGAAGNGAAAEPTEHESYDLDVDVIVACTGFTIDFDWITTSADIPALDTNPRTWFKHCFPAGMGEYLAFVGFARPHSGGIPQCSEMVSRYIAQLYLGNLTLPEDYPALAIADGESEKACFHLAPNYHVLVDYYAYMMSVAKLVGCMPRSIPKPGAPMDAVKYWTFPMWPCFFRTQGVGAKPDAAEEVISKFGTFDSLAPMPLVALEIVLTFVMPFVNGLSLLADKVLPEKFTQRVLPRFYKWRMSKAYYLYHNSLTLDDFKIVPTQWFAAIIITGHLIVASVTSAIGSKKKFDEVMD